MKTILRRSNDRLKTKIDWLESYHTFSFGEHYDPNWMGFKNLRVINDDYIKAGQGFPFHPHRNMEIITFMLNGSLRHQDSLGNNETIRPGELQVMSAGTGIVHSEFSENQENEDRVHLLQIWIMPKENNIKPRYDQKQILQNKKDNSIDLIATDDVDHANDVMAINANAKIFHGAITSGHDLKFETPKDKALWVHVFNGKLNINSVELNTGDAIGILDLDETINFKNNENQKAEFLIFEL